MNFKDMVIPLILAVATTWAAQYFFFGKKDNNEQYQFSAPQSVVECSPLHKDVDFVTPAKWGIPTVTQIETTWAHLEFTTEGAALHRLEFKRKVDGSSRVIRTVFPREGDERMYQPFLIALADKTPLIYSLNDITDHNDAITLKYGAACEQAQIYKSFIIYKQVCKIEVKIDAIPLENNTITPRIFYPAPIMPELKDQEQVAGDILYGTDIFKKLSRSSISPETYWVKPLLFGVENKYFAHTLIEDAQSFVQRAYYKLVGKQGLIAIIEGPQITQPASWTLSFYVGPKETSAMREVDERLEQLLDYSGIWAPISRMLLSVLNWLNDYLHNYGIALIVLTLLIKLILLPFSWRAEQGMKNRTEMQKRLQYIQQKYKDNPQARAQAQAEFMKKHGLGLAGCLPLLLQVPIFLGLSRVLSSAIELYQAPFLWMNDLSVRDPYYILPMLVMFGMLGSAFNSYTDTKQRMPFIAMALAFGAVSASMSAGLTLYIALGTLLNLAQGTLFKFFRLV